MSQFVQLASVNHNGLVVAFARNQSKPGSPIYYNVLGLNVDSADDQNDWLGFKKLIFPTQIRPAGMSIITLTNFDSVYTPLDTAPFRAITDEKYISVIRQTEKGTLLVNRFNLTRVGPSSQNQEAPANYELYPVWEVRYERSQKQDVPADQNDTQNFLSPDGTPFYEPTIEVAMVDDVVDGRFDVLFLPVQDSANHHWQFVAFNSSTNMIDLYNFPSADNGLLDLTGSQLVGNLILPDTSFTIHDAANNTLSFLYAPKSLLYTKHENIIDENNTKTVKRNGRVLFALVGTVQDKTVTAFLDVAVSTKGTLAAVNGTVSATEIEPASYALQFDGYSYISLSYTGSTPSNNPLAIKGPFGFSLWFSPSKSSSSIQWIIGGDQAAEDRHVAPFIALLNNSVIQVGFGNGTDLVTCQTSNIQLDRSSWYFLELSYSGLGQDPFTLTINNVVHGLSNCTTNADPYGTPVSYVSSAENGFIGIIDQVQITTSQQRMVFGLQKRDESDLQQSVVVDLRLDSVDYSVSPPTTPTEVEGSEVVAEVFGANLVQSTAPIHTTTTGKFNVDADGLTWYSGIADFITPKSSPDLMEGSEALLHLYFQNEDDLFCVAHFSTLVERAAFSLPWSAWVDSNETEQGTVSLIARRSGSFLNEALVSVSDCTSSLECMNISMSSGVLENATETWIGVPRSLVAASAVLNGTATNDPNNPDLINGGKFFFDYEGAYMSVIAQTAEDRNGTYFQFTSRIPSLVQLQSVEIAQGSANTLAITLKSVPTKWASDTGSYISQEWPNMSLNPNTVMSTFAGAQTEYDYSSVSSVDTAVYGIIAAPSKSDGNASEVSIFVQSSHLQFSIDIQDGTTNDLCNVTISGMHLPDVPRVQAGESGQADEGNFASVLNGDDPAYSYPANYKATVGKFIFVLTDSLLAHVENASLSESDKAGPLSFSNLFRAFYTGKPYLANQLQIMPETNAGIVQSGKVLFEGRSSVLSNGSFLFGMAVEDPPSSGVPGLISNTSSASMIRPGVNGGWIQESPRFAMAFNQNNSRNYVSYMIGQGFQPAESLSMDRDMSIEMWLNPTGQNTSSTHSRVLTYNVTGTAEEPNTQYSYMAGTVRGAALKFDSATQVRRIASYNPQATTIQLFVKLTGQKFAGPISSVQYLRGGGEFLDLSLDTFGRPVVKYNGTAIIDHPSSLATDKWTMLTVTAESDENSTTVALVINDGDIRDTTVPDVFSGPAGLFTVGGTSQDFAFSANGASLWERALSLQEIHDTYRYGYQNNSPGLLIRWTFTEGEGEEVTNSAASGSEYDTEVLNPKGWDVHGVFDIPFAGRNDMILVSGMIAQGWTSVAYVYNQGTGLLFDGQSYAEVNSASSLNMISEFSLEIWIKPSSIDLKKQVLLLKSGSYSLEIDSYNRVKFATSISSSKKVVDSNGRTRTVQKEEIVDVYSTELEQDKTYYVACTFESGAVDEKASTEPVLPKFYIRSTIFINGNDDKQVYNNTYDSNVQVVSSDSSFVVGKSVLEDFFYKGTIGDIRIWERALSLSEIEKVYNFHNPPSNEEGLLAFWSFSEMQGKSAFDTQSNVILTLSSNELWSLFADIATAEIYVNGMASPVSKRTSSDLGGYGDSQFTVGACISNSVPEFGYVGELEELRFWSKRLTGEQISDSINNGLSGSEDGLAGYWSFNSGSGLTVYDQTGRGNNGTLMPSSISSGPRWEPSTAPISKEDSPVLNILGGVPTRLTATINEPPSVIEYADTQRDAYGTIFSVQKRAYLYHAAVGGTVLLTGFKTGDLDTIYLGQIQTAAKVVGFIEGGPPIPSENQTGAYWVRSYDPNNPYAEASSVTLTETDDSQWSFAGTQSQRIGGGFDLKRGLASKGKFGTSVGIGAEASVGVGEYDGQVGIQTSISGDVTESETSGRMFGANTTKRSSLAPAGSWEPATQILNPDVGRRYITDNIGTAVVKSRTADLYMITLKGTNTAVKYSVVPNLDIPEDVNLIDFPINPKYIKNGTLDGKVGLKNDPDYPNANTVRGSYFNPVEAYSLKQKIERNDKALQAYYDQFETNDLRHFKSLDRVKAKYTELTSYDWSANVTRRSFANTYVWSAAGGLRAEEHSTVDQITETYSGASELNVSVGVVSQFKAVATIGGFNEFDALMHTTFQMVAEKKKERTVSFGMSCEANPTGFLTAPIIEVVDGEAVFKGYTASSAPGKVDTYRFNAFYLAPSENNFTLLKQKVIDQNWLNNSSQHGAAALREATASSNGSWRVMYRTTYVSRIPASFQPVNFDSLAPDITPPANIDDNNWIIRIVQGVVGNESTPTPKQIGDAVTAILAGSAQDDAILSSIIPWWNDFLQSASMFGSDEYLELKHLREDLLQYMIDFYESTSL